MDLYTARVFRGLGDEEIEHRDQAFRKRANLTRSLGSPMGAPLLDTDALSEGLGLDGWRRP
jgi:hypothetical protein